MVIYEMDLAPGGNDRTITTEEAESIDFFYTAWKNKPVRYSQAHSRYEQVVQIRNVASELFLAVNENGDLCWREGGKECWFILTSPDGKVRLS